MLFLSEGHKPLPLGKATKTSVLFITCPFAVVPPSSPSLVANSKHGPNDNGFNLLLKALISAGLTPSSLKELTLTVGGVLDEEIIVNRYCKELYAPRKFTTPLPRARVPVIKTTDIAGGN